MKEDNRIVLYFSLQCGLLVKCSKKRLGGIIHKTTGDNVEYYVDNDKINVTKVIPAIELAHFCVNDSYRRRKSHWEIRRGVREYSVGEYSFYKFIAPQIIDLSNIAGSQYVYSFCADDGSTDLLRYYIEKLNFELMDDMSCIRPDYDDSLECLTIKIEDLIRDTIRFDDMENVSAVIDYLKANETISNHQAKKH